MSLKSFIKRLIFREKADGATYLNYLRKRGAVIGEGTVLFSGPQHCHIDSQNPYLLAIGDNVQITHGVIMLTHDYSWSVIKGKYGEVCGAQAPLTVGNNVFIGNNAILLPGTVIGDNVVIGAGSVVKGVIPSDVVIGGVPARVICSIDEFRSKRRERQLDEAVDVYRCYYQRNGLRPHPSLFREYFWLFTSPDTPLIAEFSKVNCLGSSSITVECFSEWSPVFSSYEEFELYCLKRIDQGDGD